jgi:hypothetical protein
MRRITPRCGETQSSEGQAFRLATRRSTGEPILNAIRVTHRPER